MNDATFRLMAEAMPQLVWSTTPDGYHDYFNERWYAYTGMPRPGEPGGEGEVAQGWHWTDYLHPDDVARTAGSWTQSLRTGETYEIQYRVREAATSAYRWFLARATPLRDGEAIVRWFGTCTDIDDEKHVETTLAVLARAGVLLGSTLTVEPALAEVARIAVPAIADWCAVDLAEPGPNGTLVPRRIAVEHVDPAKVVLARTFAERYPDDPDAPGGVPYVLRTGRSDMMHEIPAELLAAAARDGEHRAAIESLGLRSYVVVPILDAAGQIAIAAPNASPNVVAPDAAPRVLGAITFVSAEGGRRYTARDVETATEIARRASLALERARLYETTVRDRERLTEQTEELSVQNERLHEQAGELEMQAAQMQDQATALEQHAMARDAAYQQLETVLEQSPVGIIIAEAPSGRFLFVNRRTHEIFGRAPQTEGIETYNTDWTGRHVDGPNAGREVETHEWPIAAAVERGEHVTGKVVEVSHRDGRLLQVSINAAPVLDATGRVVAGVIVFDDVSTERAAQAEREALVAALTMERTRLSTMFRQAPAFIAVLRGSEHVFELVNEAYSQLIGFRDVVGKPLRTALPEVVTQGFPELLDRVLGSGETFVGTEVAIALQRVPHGSLEQRHLTFVYQPLAEADGSRSGVFVHGVDVTESVRARADVERARADADAARDRAELANRAKSDFLASMSHELRTPLNAIGGYAELMELGVRGPITEAQRADLTRIRRSQRHLLTLINDILNFARIETGRVEYDLRTVSLGELVTDVAPMIEPQIAAQGLTYDVTLPTDDVQALADDEKVRQILLNLLSNAVKFTPEGGRVRVEIEAPNDEPSVVRLRVSDTGIGIPSDKLETVFDAFVQVRAGLTRTHEGTGLGLAISRDLARGMSGDLTVESEIGAGATFTLTLPRASSAQS